MRNRKRLPPPPKTVTPQPPRGILELDRFDEATLEKWNERSRDIDQLENELFYSVLPEQKRHRDEILGALASVPPLALTLENWSRIVSYQFSLQPLSCAGSMLTYGGRFNPGAELDPQTMAPFPALYLAEDYETAFREKFQLPVGGQISGLMPEELALDRGGSHTVVQVRGKGSQVFELATKNLVAVASVLSKIKMPPKALALKKKLRDGVRMITTAPELHRAALDFNWRVAPLQFGLPAQSQQLAAFIRDAGFEGICYKSTKGLGRCLALFPDRIADSTFWS